MKDYKEERTPSEIPMRFYLYGIERGERMVQFLEERGISLKGMNILDVGCGAGGISISFRKKCKRVFAIDFNLKYLDLLKKRLTERNLDGVYPIMSSAIDPPFREEEFDLVIMNGVLEWTGWNQRENPLVIQKRVLNRVFRVLKGSGLLYLAIENRLCPANLFRDPHSKVPLPILPYWMINLISLIFYGKPYQTPIHSYWELKKMLFAEGFSKVSIYAPIINYRYPILYFNLDKLTKSDILFFLSKTREIKKEYERVRLGSYLWIKVLFLRIIFRLRLAKLFAPGFVVLAYKCV